jgi:hypothetical protein
LSLASRHASPARAFIPRTILAVVLALALLSGIVPLNALSSSSHECNMSCCLGKTSHAAGSCDVAFASDEKATTPSEPDHEQRAHRGHAGHSSQTNAPHNRHHTAKQPSAHHSSTDRATPQSLSVRAQALARPCAPECAAAATSASTQTRRQRDPATQTADRKPRPQILTFRAKDFSSKWSASAGSNRLLPPRAPPLLLLNLST